MTHPPTHPLLNMCGPATLSVSCGKSPLSIDCHKTYTVSNMAKFCAKPTKQHWIAMKRIIRYLKGTQKYGLIYKKSNSMHGNCVGFSDADCGGDLDDRKSTSGYVFQVGGTAISWRSKKQACVALSTAEAEYIALTSTAQESLWLQQLLADLNREYAKSMVIFHGRSKHIAISSERAGSYWNGGIEVLQDK